MLLPESSADSEKIAAYALQVSDKSVDEQYQEVQSIRLRASFLATVNALSASLFFQMVHFNDNSVLLVALSALCFCGCNFFSIYVMMPNGTWRITKSGGAIIDQFVDSNEPLSAAQVFSVLAIKTDEDQAKNELVVRRAHSQFFFAVAFFAAGTIFWLALVVQSPRLVGSEHSNVGYADVQ